MDQERTLQLRGATRVGAQIAILVLLGSSFSASAEPAEAGAAMCNLRQGVGIGCVEGTASATANALEMFEHYGFDYAKITASYSRAYVAQFGCAAIDGKRTDRHFEFGVFDKYKIAGEDGWKTVDRVAVRWPGQVMILLIDDEYMSSSCVASGDTGDPFDGRPPPALPADGQVNPPKHG